MNKKTLFRAAALCAMAALIPACGGGGSGVGGGSLANFVDYKISGPSVHAILTKGGAGTNGSGGYGGNIEILSTAGSDVRVLKTGAINTSFPIPSGTPDLGDNPLIVSSAVTITYTGTDGVNTVAQNGLFFGQDGTTYATGLWIKSGGTLTLSPDNGATPATSNSIQVGCTRGIRIDAGGTLKTAARGDLPGDGAALRLDCLGFFSAGTVSTRSPDPTGGAAGNLQIFSFWGDLVQKGSIFANGTGTSGAAAGNVELGFGQVAGLYNTGPIDASGAPSAAAAGGAAGSISLFNWTPSETGTGPVCNSGNLTARGGAGADTGGPGGEISIDASIGWGEACTSGTLDSSGGDAGAVGGGGTGKNIKVLSWAYLLRCSGSLTSRGGAGGTTSGSGGGAGNITISRNGTNPWGVATGEGNNLGLWCSATFDASGGNARGLGANSDGGAAGIVKIENVVTDVVVPGNSPLIVAGLTEIDSSGGRANAPAVLGGIGGSVTIENLAGTDPNGVRWLGKTLNEVPITTKGGDGISDAGYGGEVIIRSFGNEPNTFPVTEFSTSNTADILTSGGTAQAFGGLGGAITIFDRSVVSNSGDLTASGGFSATAIGGAGAAITIRTDFGVFDDVGSARNTGALISQGGGGVVGGNGGAVRVYNHFRTTNSGGVLSSGGSGTASGGSGGDITIYSDVDVRNACVLLTSGGDAGTGFGGSGGLVYILGQSAAHSGNIHSEGGVSTLGAGGNGGFIRIEGTQVLAVVHGTFSVPGGATAGVTGAVLINGVPVPLTAGSVKY